MNLTSVIITPAAPGRPRRECLALGQWLYGTTECHQIDTKKVGKYRIKLYHPFESRKAFLEGFRYKIFKKLRQSDVSAAVTAPQTLASESFLTIHHAAMPPTQVSEPIPIPKKRKKRRAKTPRFR